MTAATRVSTSTDTPEGLPVHTVETLTKEETPSDNSGSTSATPNKEKKMSTTIVQPTTDKRELTDDELVDGQLYKLGDDSKWYKPIEHRKTAPAAAVFPALLEKIRNKPDNIPAIHCPFADVFDEDGNKIKWATIPDGATAAANHLYRENGITYVGQGFYWSAGIEEIDGIEYVNFEYGSGDLPCPVHEWCTGHALPDIEGNPDELIHTGSTRTLFEFTTGGKVTATRTTTDEGEETVYIVLDLEEGYDRMGARTLAQELLTVADKLIEYGTHMEAS